MVRFLIILGALAAWPIVALAQPAQVDDQTAVQIEALNRLKGADLESNAPLKAAVLRVLDKTHGTPQFVEIVRDFSLKGYADLLLEYAIKYPAEQSAIEAFRLAVAEKGDPAISTLLASTNAAAVVQLMANTRDKAFEPQLKSLAAKSDKPFPVRQSAVKALAQSEAGARYLLDLAKSEKLPADVKLTAASELNLAPWPEVKKSALEILPLPQTAGAEVLPPISELVKRTGNVERGRTVFESDTSA